LFITLLTGKGSLNNGNASHYDYVIIFVQNIQDNSLNMCYLITNFRRIFWIRIIYMTNFRTILWNYIYD